MMLTVLSFREKNCRIESRNSMNLHPISMPSNVSFFSGEKKPKTSTVYLSEFMYVCNNWYFTHFESVPGKYSLIIKIIFVRFYHCKITGIKTENITHLSKSKEQPPNQTAVEFRFLPFSERKYDIQPHLKENQLKGNIT